VLVARAGKAERGGSFLATFKHWFGAKVK